MTSSSIVLIRPQWPQLVLSGSGLAKQTDDFQELDRAMWTTEKRRIAVEIASAMLTKGIEHQLDQRLATPPVF